MKRTPDPNIFISILLGILFIILIFISWYTFLLSQPQQQTFRETLEISPSPTLSPTPITLSVGDGEYVTSHSQAKGPTIQSVIFSPLDIHVRETIRIHVKISSKSAITKVAGSLQADTSTTELTFTKTGGKNTYEIWSTELTLSDTVNYTYILHIAGYDANGETTITVAPRS